MLITSRVRFPVQRGGDLTGSENYSWQARPPPDRVTPPEPLEVTMPALDGRVVLVTGADRDPSAGAGDQDDASVESGHE